MVASVVQLGKTFIARRLDANKPLMHIFDSVKCPVLYKTHTPSRAILASYNVNGLPPLSSFIVQGDDFFASTDVNRWNIDFPPRTIYAGYWKIPMHWKFGISLSWNFSIVDEEEYENNGGGYIGSWSGGSGVLHPLNINVGEAGLNNVIIEDWDREFYLARCGAPPVPHIPIVRPQNGVKWILDMPHFMSPTGTKGAEFYQDDYGFYTLRAIGDGEYIPMQGRASITGLPVNYLRGGIRIEEPSIMVPEYAEGSVTVRYFFHE